MSKPQLRQHTKHPFLLLHIMHTRRPWSNIQVDHSPASCGQTVVATNWRSWLRSVVEVEWKTQLGTPDRLWSLKLYLLWSGYCLIWSEYDTGCAHYGQDIAPHFDLRLHRIWSGRISQTVFFLYVRLGRYFLHGLRYIVAVFDLRCCAACGRSGYNVRPGIKGNAFCSDMMPGDRYGRIIIQRR